MNARLDQLTWWTIGATVGTGLTIGAAMLAGARRLWKGNP